MISRLPFWRRQSGATSGTLSVTDGTHTANITLFGQYVADQFQVSNDGGGHVLVTDPPVATATDLSPLALQYRKPKLVVASFEVSRN